MKKKIALLLCAQQSYYVQSFITGMQRATKDLNVDIYCFAAYKYTELSGFPNNTGFSVFNLIHYEDYCGAIILADLISNPRILERERLRILKAGIPAISINAKMEGLTIIKDDNYSAFKEMMEHLIKSHNYKDFGYMSGRESAIDISERYKAFRDVLNENNIQINMNLVFTLQQSDYSYAYNYLTDYIKNGHRLPQVLVCANDLLAMAAIKVAKENRIDVPEQLKVVGYDDSSYAKNIKPAISTVKSNTEQIGYEAVNRLLSGKNDVAELKIKGTPVYRETCGCNFPSATRHDLFALDIMDASKKSEIFTNHMDNIEEVFTEATDVFTLLTNLELCFGNSHDVEGSDFCIFLKSDWTSVLINSAEHLPQNLDFGPQVQSIVSIQENKKYPREMINTQDLMPAKMRASEGSNLYIFMPIYNHAYIHGYFVCKNNLTIISNQFGYFLTRGMGSNIERFRKKNMYKQMSQQFLKLSTSDGLSGMLNRVGLEKIVKPFYAQNRQNGLTTVLFFVDINKMKHINDNFGHLHGDLAVKTVSAAAMEIVPKNWYCVRYGGDEFLVVGNSKNYNGEDYCTQITNRLKEKTSVMHLPYNLSASVGTISIPPNSTLTLEQAVEEVDKIMYEKKQAFHKEDDKKNEATEA